MRKKKENKAKTIQKPKCVFWNPEEESELDCCGCSDINRLRSYNVAADMADFCSKKALYLVVLSITLAFFDLH